MLAIQVSTVASESTFSADGRVIDPYRNRLGPDMVEALICTKDWVAASRKGDFYHISCFNSVVIIFTYNVSFISVSLKIKVPRNFPR